MFSKADLSLIFVVGIISVMFNFTAGALNTAARTALKGKSMNRS